MLKETTFDNVTITVPASTPELAYARLCSALAAVGAEWSTSEYSVDGGEYGPTAGLFPRDGSG